MAETYTFNIAHVGKEGTGDFGQRFGRIDERKTVTVQANSLDDAKKQMKASSSVARNKEQAIKRQNQDGTPAPRLVVKSIVQNPNTPNQKILKETALQKEMRSRINTQVKAVPFVSSKGAGFDVLADKDFGFPKPDLVDIFDTTSDYSGLRYTKAGNEFEIYNRGGVVKGNKGGLVRQFKHGGKVRLF